jgi:hypothetical protein
MQSSSLGRGFVWGVAEKGRVAIDTKANHRAAVSHTPIYFQRPQGGTQRGRVAEQPTEEAKRGQGASLPDQEPEMAAARVIGRESEQAADGGEWDGPIVVEEAGIQARFSDEAVEVRAEFHQDGADRAHDIGMDEANGRRPLSPVGTLVRGCPV